MIKVGTKVIMKSDGCIGIIKDCWHPNLNNPIIYSSSTPTGYLVLLDNGNNRMYRRGFRFSMKRRFGKEK